MVTQDKNEVNIKMSETEEKTRLVQSVDRAIRMVKILAAKPQGLSLSELAGQVELPVQTVQGLLKTLQAHQWVNHLGRGKPYLLGPGIHQLSRQSLDLQDKAVLAREPVFSLSRKIGEYVLLVELRGTYSIALVEARSDQPLNVNYESGSFIYLHSMSTGKILLAFLPADRQEQILEKLKLVDDGLNNEVTLKRLRKELQEVIQRGYATHIQEKLGVGSIAVPVFGVHGNVVAALGTSAPLTRFDEERREKLRRELLKTAGEIQKGWTGI